MSELTAIFDTLQAQFVEVGPDRLARTINLSGVVFDRVQNELLKQSRSHSHSGDESFSSSQMRVHTDFGIISFIRKPAVQV